MHGWAEELPARVRGLSRTEVMRAKNVSPSVNTAHMVRWADSHLERVLIAFRAMNMLSDVDAVAQKHALELPIRSHLLTVDLKTANEHADVDHRLLCDHIVPNLSVHRHMSKSPVCLLGKECLAAETQAVVGSNAPGSIVDAV